MYIFNKQYISAALFNRCARFTPRVRAPLGSTTKGVRCTIMKGFTRVHHKQGWIQGGGWFDLP